MKKVLYIIAAAATLLAAASCSKTEQNSPSKSGRRIHLTVKAEKPEFTDEAGTKVTFSGQKLVWEGTEKLQVLIGNNSSTTAATGRQVELDQVSDGVFDGFVDLGDYTEDDIKAIVVGPASYYNYRSGQNRIIMPVAYNQTQSASGVLNGDMVPVFAKWDAAYIQEEDGADVIAGASLQYGCALMQYTIKADVLPGSTTATGAGESIESITVTQPVNACGTSEYRMSASGDTPADVFTYNSSSTVGTVTLDTPVTIGDSESEAVFYQAVLSRYDGTNGGLNTTLNAISKIVVHTDKAVYTKTFDPRKEFILHAGQLKPVTLNLSTFTRVGNIEYSTDEGQTWEPEIPAAQSFSTLAVRSAIPVTKAQLEEIAAAVKEQSGLVDVDLSRTTIEQVEATVGYEDDGSTVKTGLIAQFPAVFGSNTADNAAANLKSIKLPSNTKALANYAFANCEALETFDLSTFEYLSPTNGETRQFKKSGLKTLVIPNTMTGRMSRAFVSTWKLESIYYNATWNASTGYNYRCFQGNDSNSESDASADATHAKEVDLVLTIGPDAVTIPQNCFRNNHNLTKVVIEGSDNLTLQGSCFFNCDNLEEFDLQGEYPPKISSYSVYGSRSGSSPDYVYTPSMGTSVASSGRKIYVPAGKLYVYQSHANWPAWEDMAARCGYEIIDPDPVVVEAQYSADGSTWSTAIPTTFTTLYVKGIATADDLDAIKAAIDAQGTAVSLDMSQAQYANSTFPKLFAGTGSSARYTLLKGIKFPSNVKEIAANAFDYCDLEEVELDGIETINGYAFRSTKLKNLVVPKSVTSMPGSYTFGYCWDLETVYYDSPAQTVSGVNAHTFSLRNTSAVESLPSQYSAGNHTDLVYTFGPNAYTIREQDFDTNHKLVKIIFLKTPDLSLRNSWAVRARYLKVIDMTALETPPGTSNTSNMALTGDLVPENEREIWIPAGKKANFEGTGVCTYLVNTRKYSLVEK